MSARRAAPGFQKDAFARCCDRSGFFRQGKPSNSARRASMIALRMAALFTSEPILKTSKRNIPLQCGPVLRRVRDLHGYLMPLYPVVNGRCNPIKPLPLPVSQRDASRFTLVSGAIPACRSAVVEHQQDRGARARVRRNDLSSIEFNLNGRGNESFGSIHQ